MTERNISYIFVKNHWEAPSFLKWDPEEALGNTVSVSVLRRQWTHLDKKGFQETQAEAPRFLAEFGAIL